MSPYREEIQHIFPEMVSWRRHLHMWPELSFHETETARFVYEKLDAWGIETKRHVGGHGVMATIYGENPGPTVALRADMDALPIQDEKTCAYASKVPGVMHACGHDAHTATLLGVAKILQEHRHELKGDVRLIFQPAEEVCPGGAKPMIEDGVLSGVDVIYGVHLWTPLPVGTMASVAGPIMASADEFEITIKGKGGHAGFPHESIDSVYIGSTLVVNIQSIVSRHLNPVLPGVVTVGSIHAGSQFNIIAETCELKGTVRTFDEQARKVIRERLETIVRHTCEMYGADVHMEYRHGYPAVVNHPSEADRFFHVAGKIVGERQVRTSPLIMAGEDFSYYLQCVPGCFMFVGAGNEREGKHYAHHHPKFDLDEHAMKDSAALLLGMTMDFMRSHTHSNNISSGR